MGSHSRPQEERMVASLGGLRLGGKLIMETQDELVIELPCGMFIRIKK